MVEFFKALSEESRLRILSLLLEREMCVCEIEASLKMTQSNASRHLTALKNSGILDSFKKAQWTYYRINDRFKRDHAELWEYLQYHLRELPTYKIDLAEYQKCSGQKLCDTISPQQKH
ncbi:transcriptional regulator [Caproiciproducens sp. NJN-50]|jgi:ArsR family transcriptional regulator|uniref:ArsR/SmtB family transcription factor n=1 Tax=Caproiciproducens sp. NJN-50 TaxID=2507162 RepID=UPI000828CDC6|nr:metalloregulator ArsR/SmtB family transcription factor [Caproiciproducens sp. NJN-50]MCI2036095.1 metalloregulator ArsR/SmtB family transcription factor [Oscillospiraceae bacterium]OCN00443.1 transcriptional regulator [Clostridium sp. W14A]QAT49883.1 transcriptional regulator [Caproiciproducens sp. NJN-50]